jgi:sulfur relay (sulfurtransferase) DsrC/TusE family protein
MANSILGNQDEIFDFVQCRFFQIGIMPALEIIEQIASEIQKTSQFQIYLCSDGDLIFQSTSNLENIDTISFIKEMVMQHYRSSIESVMTEDEFFKEYNTFNAIKSLKVECFKKQGKTTKSTSELLRYMQNELLIQTFKKTIQLVSMQRVMRVNPHILIVEDQISRHCLT